MAPLFFDSNAKCMLKGSNFIRQYTTSQCNGIIQFYFLLYCNFYVQSCKRVLEMSEKKEQSDELLYEKGKLLTSYFPPITPPKKLGCERVRITSLYDDPICPIKAKKFRNSHLSCAVISSSCVAHWID